MHNFIENLRNKSEAYRHRVAFWSAFGFTAIIFTIWLATFSVNIINPTKSLAGANGTSQDKTNISKKNSDSKTMMASLGGVWEEIKSALIKPKKVIYTEVEVMPGK